MQNLEKKRISIKCDKLSKKNKKEKTRKFLDGNFSKNSIAKPILKNTL